MTLHRLMLAAVLLAAPALAQVHPADPPARPGSGMPFLAMGKSGPLLSWLEPLDGKGHQLRLARWTGESWSEPATIAQGNNWFVNWADFPAVTELPGGTLLAHWLERVGNGKYGYGIRVARSASLAGPWSPEWLAQPSDPEDYSGFLAFLSGPHGNGAVYLAPPPAAGSAKGHGGHDGHRKTLRFTSFNHAGAPGIDRELDADVCSCCQTAVVATRRGLVVAYRDHQPGEIRDISIVRLTQGQWSGPQTLHADNWLINACPTEGPAMAAADDAVAIAWMTRAQDKPRVQAIFSRNGGVQFGAPVRIDDGNPLGRPAAVLLGEDLLVVWLEKTAGGAEVRLRRVTPRGALGKSVVIAPVTAARSTGFPKLVVVGKRILIAWREERVRAGWLDAAEVPR